MNVAIRVNTIKEKDIFLHLQKLSVILEGVDINVYAKKISQYATTIEAWNGSELVGLCACYMND